MADFDSPMKFFFFVEKFSNEVELAERVWELSFIVIIIIVQFSFIEAWGGDLSQKKKSLRRWSTLVRKFK